MEELDAFIESNPDSRELKRALAVSMTLRGYPHKKIMKTLNVCSGFISKWKQAFIMNGVQGLKLAYQGSKGYLSQEEKKEVLTWLAHKDTWNLNALEGYIAENFGVKFAAKSSYYELFHKAGVSWKKSKNHRKEPEAVAVRKKEIEEFIASTNRTSSSSNVIENNQSTSTITARQNSWNTLKQTR